VVLPHESRCDSEYWQKKKTVQTHFSIAESSKIFAIVQVTLYIYLRKFSRYRGNNGEIHWHVRGMETLELDMAMIT
jgi:hypothetical protein